MAGPDTTVHPSADPASRHTAAHHRPRLRRTWLVVALAAVSTSAWGSGTSQAATSVVGHWEFDEGPGATTMLDSGPYGLHGVIGPAIQSGVVHAGAVGYRWPFVSPTLPPAKPERIAYVPSSSRLNPDSGDYAIEFRYRTTRSFGNIVQKGQNGTPGGYFKFEQPNGYITCLFKGGNGQQRAVRSPVKTNDGNWHTIRCERTATYIRLFVDGVQVRRLNGPTGNIANTQRVSIGGKSNCDQITTTCDYFTGDIDYVKIEKAGAAAPPPNQPPAATFAPSCSGLTCSFDSAGSSDGDGTIVQRQWTFGDGNAASGTVVQHTYAAPGSYTVRLTVTDDDGASSQTQRTVDVGQPDGEISYAGGNASAANATVHRTTLPAVQAGDALLLFLTVNAPVGVGSPSGVGGWELLDTAASSNGSTTVWTKVAAPGDGGRIVTIPTAARAKSSVGVVAYRGTSATPVATFAHTIHTSGAGRTTPVVPVDAPGSVAVSYWAHRDSTSTSLAPQGGVVNRLTGTQSGGGRITVLLVDSGGSVAAGSYGGLTATAQTASSFGTSWTVVLAPG